ncbi:MAG: DUF2281 domain-containing protein, partial [Spirochaetes bacterium]|nr:DUF2281 domain-containing protein [Spirochaetota bacterium]
MPAIIEKELKDKISKLPDDLKKEVLDYTDYLLNKYSSTKTQQRKKENPFKDLAGFVSIGELSSKDIDKEIY